MNVVGLGVLWEHSGHLSSIGQGTEERRLLIKMEGELVNGEVIPLLVLVDTGAEVNVIALSKVEWDVWTPLSKPWKLVAANQQRLKGGDKELAVILKMVGHQVDTGQENHLKIPTSFVSAELDGIDAIVSYGWLASNNFLVNGKRHGLCYQGPGTDDMIWIPGLKRAILTSMSREVGDQEPLVDDGSHDLVRPASGQNQSRREFSSDASPPRMASNSPPCLVPTKQRVLLDLYSGTGSVARVFRERGYHVITVDLDPKYEPDIRIDMLTWEYWLAFPKGYFSVIACTPPVLNSVGLRQ